MSNKYILKEHEPIFCDDLIKWARWFEKGIRRVAQTSKGRITVSTVFLGIDHGLDGNTPLLFETMIFGGKHDEYQERCSTWEQAEEMHKRACELARIKP